MNRSSHRHSEPPLQVGRRSDRILDPRRWLALFLFLAVPRHVEAHRLDECLQATLIEITPDEAKVQVNINPGVQVSEAMVWMIDRNRDGDMSAGEKAKYIRTFLGELNLLLDDRPLNLAVTDTDFDSIPDLRSGVGNIHIELRAPLPRIKAGDHILEFHNSHLPRLSAYLVNAVLAKWPGIEILKQKRSENQSLGRIYFSIAAPIGHTSRTPGAWGLVTLLSLIGGAFLFQRRKIASGRISKKPPSVRYCSVTSGSSI